MGGKAIAVEYTEQKLSAHAGSATFWAWLHATDWKRSLQRHLPHAGAKSNNHLMAVDKALAFTHGLLCAARKLTHVAYFRRDPLVPSQSALSRFFGEFTSAGRNLACFRPLWRWGLAQLSSRKDGYTLDLDSTRLLHEDGHQEGVRSGYTRLGIKPCLHPLLAVVAEVRLVAQLWLFTPPEWQALSLLVTDAIPVQPPTLGTAVGLLARLGGYLARNADGTPGHRTIARGLRSLHAALRLAEKLRPDWRQKDV